MAEWFFLLWQKLKKLPPANAKTNLPLTKGKFLPFELSVLMFISLLFSPFADGPFFAISTFARVEKDHSATGLNCVRSI